MPALQGTHDRQAREARVVRALRGRRLISLDCVRTPVYWSVMANRREIDEGRHEMRQLQRMADRVSSLILNSDYPDVDIEIEIAKLREATEAMFPGRQQLFSMIYESRFERLRQQFRSGRE